MNKRHPDSTAKARIQTDYKKLQLVWGRMRQSCTDVNHKSYKNYGAKGVTVDAEAWPTGAAFADWALLNGFEPGLTVERIDSAGNYTPSNVTFASRLDQQRNRTTNVYYDYFGEQLTMGEVFERELGGYFPWDVSRALYRMQRGWDLREAVHTPPHVQNVTTYDYQGEQLTLFQIAKRYFDNPTHRDTSRLYDRVGKGWSVEDALTRPVSKHVRKKPAAEYLA